MFRIRRLIAFLGDPRVAKLPRFAVIAAAAYLLWPLDMVPEIAIPIAGWLDDVTLVWLAVRWLSKAGQDAVEGPAAQLDLPTARRVDPPSP